jgi:hypothetical protein
MSIKHVSAIEYLDNSEREYNSKKVKKEQSSSELILSPSPGLRYYDFESLILAQD